VQSVAQIVEKVVRRQVRQRVQSAVQPGVLQNIIAQEMNAVILAAFNAQLVDERDKALGRDPYERGGHGASRNGFKDVRLPGLWGWLTVRRPVVRKGTLKLPLLDALKGLGTGLRDALAVRFWLRGTSTRAVGEELEAITGRGLSAAAVSRLSNTLEPVLREWETRPIPPGIIYLFLDALYLPVRRPGFTNEQALLVALGVDEDGRTHVLGFSVGDRESKDSWDGLLKDLIARGLDPKAQRLVVSDAHKGIIAAVAERLNAPHQLCVVHKLRNVKYRVARPDWKAFLADFRKVFWADNRDRAFEAAGALRARWGAAYPKAVEIALTDLDEHLRFMAEPSELWTLLRTSNLIERFNRELRRRLRSAGAMQSELEISKLVWSVSQAQERRWRRRPLRSKKDRVQVQVQEFATA
jgi:transposase-like protein